MTRNNELIVRNICALLRVNYDGMYINNFIEVFHILEVYYHKYRLDIPGWVYDNDSIVHNLIIFKKLWTSESTTNLHFNLWSDLFCGSMGEDNRNLIKGK
jgi:hypothetical protein